MTMFRMLEGTGYLRALVAGHATTLRRALREKDRGASAIELAIITAVLVGLAVLILTIIYNFAQGQANTITTHTIPGGGGNGGGGNH
jgi:multisubunit Na+/H+ antiporter MnhB subunit